MQGKYKKVLLFTAFLLTVFFLWGCSGKKVEDGGELIRNMSEQIEMYI